MNSRKYAIALCLFTFAAPAGLSAQSMTSAAGDGDAALSANLLGIASGPGGDPLPGAQVSARSLDDRAVVARYHGADGVFAIAALKPGRYELKAAKDNLHPSGVTVDLADNQSLRADVKLSEVAVAAKAPAGNFFHRFLKAYADDWKGSSGTANLRPSFAVIPRRQWSAFSFSVWPYGGTVIGQPWTQSAPLMQAMWSGPRRLVEAQRNSDLGWLNAGVNISTSKGGGYSNFPEAYAERQDFELDQEVLYIERQPDTVQTDHVDWGFRLAAFYGLDYRFTTAKGYLSNQLLGKNRENGFDLPMSYFDLYVPGGARDGHPRWTLHLATGH